MIRLQTITSQLCCIQFIVYGAKNQNSSESQIQLCNKHDRKDSPINAK